MLVVAFLAAACAQTGGSGGDKGEIILASDFPTSGADRASGRGPEAGAAYAVQTNATIKGFKITFKGYDDAVNGVHDPQKGAQNVTDMCNNPKILAMAGPFNSNVARATIPVANKCNLAMMSPANTNECLTQDFAYCDPKPSALRDAAQPNNYFRIAAPDTVQGPAMADFAYDTLKVTKIAIWSDNETFGKGVADNFAKRFSDVDAIGCGTKAAPMQPCSCWPATWTPSSSSPCNRKTLPACEGGRAGAPSRSASTRTTARRSRG
jgi:branched-chain amino acid transport system substrate-binding protein